jgi:hypothetical protein
MSDPFKGQPSNKQPAQPKSQPVKLAKYTQDKGGPVNPRNPDANNGYSEKLPRK